jgi:acyl dehydratase
VAWDLEAVRRAWEGHETPLAWGRYPIEHDPIRRHCHMVDDTNPRFLERGECPPVMVDYFAAGGAGPDTEPDILPLVRRIPTPGDRLVNLGHEFEWFRTARVGERLGARHRVLAIEVRPTRLDPLSVWIRTATTIVNERQEVVATRLNQIMVHRPGATTDGGDSPSDRRTPEALRGRPDGEGEELPRFSLPLTMTRMVLQVSGSQDFYPVHHDRDFARAGGHADIFLNTGFIRAALCRLLTDWMGDAGVLQRLSFQMRRPHLLGDTITVRGRVTGRRRDGERGAVDLDVWIENPRDGVATPGRATVCRPGGG